MRLLGWRLLRQGFQPGELLVDESAPDERVTLQAEVMNSDRFIEMRFAVHSGIGMRQAYDIMHHTRGSVAMAILRRYLDAAAMDKLEEILATYRDSIVELSAYDCSVGVLGWNTLFWEVRNY